MHDTSDPVQVIPVLPSMDLDRTRVFFAKLGFEYEWACPKYLLLKRAEIELHYWLCENRAICEATSCYIRGGGIDALYAAFSSTDFKGLSPLSLQSWNMVEFHFLDPDGVLLRFGRIPEKE